jgi:hypothetical protein
MSEILFGDAPKLGAYREAAEKGKTEIKDFTESAKRSGAEGKDTSSLSAWCPFREVFSTG